MRLDKFFVHVGRATRSEATKLIRSGAVTVDGIPLRDPSAHIDPEAQCVCLRGELVPYRLYTYLMLNKPQGYISATDDPRQKTVLHLLSEQEQRLGLFPCGRLDKDTVGLLILTNDGALAHRLLSPKHHVEKTYSFECESPLHALDCAALEAGVTLEDGYQTLPCRIRMYSETKGEITITEGKFHQIKRMLQARENRITFLRRISFGNIALDPDLKEGEYRPLTKEEIDLLQSHR
jgi:16S rRNA pseudouridine516 synthase